MKTISSVFAKTLGRLGQRGAFFGVALPELAAERHDIWVLTADLATLSGLDRFSSLYPDRFLNAGIAEQNMIGVATGLAFDGKTVFATTYATFIAMRSIEQIRHNLGYQKANVKAVGGSAGFVMGMSGNTHYTFEDIAMMRSIPNMTIISPADSVEAYKVAYAAADFQGPVYIRLTGGLNCPLSTNPEDPFQIGKSGWLYGDEKADIGIIATGISVHAALEAAKLLEKEGILVSVVNMHTIKPLDTEIIRQLCDTVKLLVTVEEHNVIGGLGSAVAEYKATLGSAPPQLFIGIPDTFCKPGSYDYLLRQYGLTSSAIAEKIRGALK
ncbi:MAG: transketolase family protein [Thermoguttaceae bacterium]|nr:transketolase family protein [Thermoguttaceae bacterium]